MSAPDDDGAVHPPILQFGTSRFLQAHVDLFVAEAAREGRALGRITVVQTTSSAQSRARIAALRAHGSYPVRIRGQRNGRTVDTSVQCDSVAEALHADDDWPAIRARVAGTVEVIVSNTGDSGYACFAEDTADLLAGHRTPRGFGAKLAVLLHARFAAGGRPITLLPCELVSRNGETLQDLVIGVARGWNAAPDFLAYLAQRCIWVNSLVDRIVSEPIEPIGAVAEPYALWAIERREGMVLPCRHEAIELTDDLARYERFKLFMLNLGHTMLAEQWLAEGSPAAMTVLDAMRSPSWRAMLEAVWRDEVLPVFAALGQREAAEVYLCDVRDRFDNPFFAHRLADIAGNHEQKKQRRLAPAIALADELRLGIAQPRLRAAVSGAGAVAGTAQS
jgi:tagaturonate reductase